MSRETESTPVVLLVDDDEDVRALHRQTLLDAGFAVHEAATVAECLELARELRPAVVVMDRNLSDGDGFDAVKLLKALSSTRDACFIAHTAHTLRADVQRSIEVGCDTFLGKPCPPEVLLLHIRRLLRIRA